MFSDIVPAALRSLPDALRARLSVVQQTRPEDLERVKAAYAADGISAELSPFFPDVAARLAAAHLVIARAGASTVAELAVAGRPAILVPLPGAIDDHQSANARALAEAGGAWVVPQPQFTPAFLAERLNELLADPAGLTAAAAGARSQARADAAARLADLVEARMTARGGRARMMTTRIRIGDRPPKPSSRPSTAAAASRSRFARVVSRSAAARKPFARSAILPFSVALRDPRSSSVLKSLLAEDRAPGSPTPGTTSGRRVNPPGTDRTMTEKQQP